MNIPIVAVLAAVVGTRAEIGFQTVETPTNGCPGGNAIPGVQSHSGLIDHLKYTTADTPPMVKPPTPGGPPVTSPTIVEPPTPEPHLTEPPATPPTYLVPPLPEVPPECTEANLQATSPTTMVPPIPEALPKYSVPTSYSATPPMISLPSILNVFPTFATPATPPTIPVPSIFDYFPKYCRSGGSALTPPKVVAPSIPEVIPKYTTAGGLPASQSTTIVPSISLWGPQCTPSAGPPAGPPTSTTIFSPPLPVFCPEYTSLTESPAAPSTVLVPSLPDVPYPVATIKEEPQVLSYCRSEEYSPPSIFYRKFFPKYPGIYINSQTFNDVPETLQNVIEENSSSPPCDWEYHNRFTSSNPLVTDQTGEFLGIPALTNEVPTHSEFVNFPEEPTQDILPATSPTIFLPPTNEPCPEYVALASPPATTPTILEPPITQACPQYATPPPPPTSPTILVPPIPEAPDRPTIIKEEQPTSHIMRIPRRYEPSSITIITLNSPLRSPAPNSVYSSPSTATTFSSPPPSSFYTRPPPVQDSCPATPPIFQPTNTPGISVYPPFTCPAHPPSLTYPTTSTFLHQLTQPYQLTNPSLPVAPTTPSSDDKDKTIASFNSIIPDIKLDDITINTEETDPLLAVNASKPLEEPLIPSPEVEVASDDCSMPVPPVLV